SVQRDELDRPGFIFVAGVWAWVVAMVGMMPWVLMRQFDTLPWVGTALLSVGAIVYGVCVFQSFQSRKPATAAAVMGAGLLAMVVLLYTLYLPNASFLRMSPRVAQILRDDGA